MKKISFVIVIFLSILRVSAQESAGFIATANTIKIQELLPNTISQINKIEAKEDKIIQIEKDITQEDFDKICSKLKWIKKLYIDYDNPNITNILSVGNLSTLESLRMRNVLSSLKMPIDMLPLVKLITLKEIDFYGTHITNTDLLQTLVNLEKVNLNQSNISSLTFLQFTPLVKELTLSGDNHTFKNFDAIQNLKKIRVLDLQKNPIVTDETLNILSNLAELREITISECNGITSLNFLKNSTKLQEIIAINCKNIIDVSGLQDLIQLRRVNFSGTPISTVSFITNKSELKELNISGSNVSDISPITNCLAIERLDISKTSIADMSSISTLIKLKKLNISNTQISDLTSLNNNIAITDLEASDTKISDISTLATCKKLANINLLRTNISDIKPLYGLDKISSLTINNSIPQAQIDAIKIRFPLIRIDFNDKK